MIVEFFTRICILVLTSVSFLTVVNGAGVDAGNGIVYKAPANADTFLYDGPN